MYNKEDFSPFFFILLPRAEAPTANWRQAAIIEILYTTCKIHTDVSNQPMHRNVGCFGSGGVILFLERNPFPALPSYPSPVFWA